MKNLIKYLIFSLCIFIISCKRDNDTVTTQNIKGQVYNLTTDSGLANIIVYLKINDSRSTNSFSTVSGVNGNFTFTNVQMHSSNQYSYNLHIPSVSGIGGVGVGFNGTTVTFTNNQANTFFKLNVVPKFFLFTLSFNHTPITSANDSVVILMNQYIFHKNVPDLPYSLGGKHYGDKSTQSGTIGNYPMGLWNLKIDKWKSGVYTATKDSIYLGYGATSTYTVNW